LYVPGDDTNKINKAAALGADSVCLDMEDGVAANRKGEARTSIAAALQKLDFGNSERLARTNPVGSGLEQDDLAAVLPARPDGIVVPKVESGEQVRWVSQQIAACERQNGWPEGSIRLIVQAETARALLNLHDIVSADPRLDAIIFGAEDFANDIGAVRSREGWEVFYARSAIVTYTAAYGLQAIDMVFVDYKDIGSLKQEALQGARMGFAGKQVIHPAQVAPVQEAFTPSDEAIANALHIIELNSSYQQAGKGAFGLEGRMVDAPVVKAAERVLVRARAAGKLPPA